MKKILVATGLYPPDIGGPATYARMLEEELPKNGITPEVVPFGQVRHLPKLWRHIAYYRLIRKKAPDFDAVYALDSISVGLPALFAARRTRKPFLVRLGGDYAWEQGRIRYGLTSTLDEYTADPSGRPLMVRLFAFVQSFVVRRAQIVIAPSAYLKSIIVTWGVRDERVKVVHSALFPLPVSDTREVLRAQLGYKGVVLITAARLTPWKGVGHVIELIARMQKDFPEIALIVAGDGEARQSLEAKATELQVEDRVRFVGKLSKEALGAALKGADVFVYNTSYEGLPHQLLEVMDLGLPIVTTNIPGNREAIKDGIEGLLVAPNDIEALEAAVRRVLGGAELRAYLTKNARLRSKDFLQERVTTTLVEVLENI